MSAQATISANPPDRCPSCGYALAGLPTDQPPRCPECGRLAMASQRLFSRRWAIALGLFEVIMAALGATVLWLDPSPIVGGTAKFAAMILSLGLPVTALGTFPLVMLTLRWPSILVLRFIVALWLSVAITFGVAVCWGIGWIALTMMTK